MKHSGARVKRLLLSNEVHFERQSIWFKTEVHFGLKGVVDCFFSRLDCVYRVQSNIC